MRFTAKVKHNSQVTIPYDIAQLYEINRYDYVELEVVQVKKK